MTDGIANLATVGVAILALLFTIFATWYMYWRPGKLEIGTISTFGAGVGSEGDKRVLIIGLPLRLVNAGAQPVVVDLLRLRIEEVPELGAFHLERVEEDFFKGDPEKSDYMPVPFIVNPSQGVQLNCTFEAKGSDYEFEAKDYHAIVEYRPAGKTNWKTLTQCELQYRDLNSAELWHLNNAYRGYQHREIT